MSIFYVTRFGLIAPALAVLGVAATGASVDGQAQANGAALKCSIAVERLGSAVELKALVSAPREASGSYRLTVTTSGGGNSSAIDQSGGFTAGGRGAEVISRVMLGGDGKFTARLSVTADGRTVECRERVGGSI